MAARKALRTIVSVVLGIAAALAFSVSWAPSVSVSEVSLPERIAADFSANLDLSGLTIAYALVFGTAFFVKPTTGGTSWARRVIIPVLASVALSFGWSIGMLYQSAAGDVDDVRLFRMVFLLCVYLLVFYRVAYVACAMELPHKSKALHADDDNPWVTTRAMLVFWLVIFTCWLPYLILLYPGVCAPNDTIDQLQQLAGVESFTSQMAGQLADGFYLNNHHPVVYTLFLGAFFFGGQALGSTDVGMFAAVLVQAIALSVVFAASVKAIGGFASRPWQATCVAFYALNPVFPMTAVCLTKDVLFTVFLVACILLMLKGLRRESEGRKWCLYVGVACCVLFAILLRNTELYVLLLWLVCFAPFMLTRDKRMLVGIGSGVIAAALIVQCLYPVLSITPGSSGEMLAVPFQQAARAVVEHGDEIDEEDLAAVDELLDVDGLAGRYNFINADAVKNNRDFNASSEETAEFLKAWAHIGKQNLCSYLYAWSGLCAGYYAPLVNGTYVWALSFGWTVSTDPDDVVDQSDQLSDIGLDVSQQGAPTETRVAIEQAYLAFRDAPIVGLVTNIGACFFAFVLAFARLAYRKRTDVCAVSALMLILFATFVLSPADHLLRYALPCFSFVPVALALAFSPEKKKIPADEDGDLDGYDELGLLE